MNHNNHGAFSAGVLLKTHHGWDFGLARLWNALKGRQRTQVPAYEPEPRSDPPIGIGSDTSSFDASSTSVLAESRRFALQSGFYS